MKITATAFCAALTLLIPLAHATADTEVVAYYHPAGDTRVETDDPFDAPLSTRAIGYVHTGDRLLRQGDRLGATRSYALAAEASPRSPLLRMMLGVALSQLREPLLVKNHFAVDEFRVASRLAEDDLMAALLLQGALVDTGEVTEAQAVYLDAVRRFAKPNRTALDASHSIKRLTHALQRFPDSPMLSLLLGDAFQVSEQWSHADNRYTRAIALAPGWAKPRVNLGLSLLAQGKAGDAIAILESALVRDPTNTQAQLHKADAELQSGRNDDAIHTYSMMVGKPRVAAQALTGMGRAYLKIGRSEDAIRTFGAAHRIAPNDPTPSAALGDAQVKIGNYDAGAENYQVALRLTKGGGLFSARPFLYRALIEAQLSARKPDDALDSIQRALTEEPLSTPLWQRLFAQAYFDKGNRTEAQMALRRALDSEISAVSTSAAYPQETLNAIAAHNLLGDIEDMYHADMSADEGSQVRGLARESGKSVNYSAPPATKEIRAVATVALAHLARYQGQTDLELHLRKQAVKMRGSASNWYLLGETYDTRKNDPQNALVAYRNALSHGDLSDVARNQAQSRCRVLAQMVPSSATPDISDKKIRTP